MVLALASELRGRRMAGRGTVQSRVFSPGLNLGMNCVLQESSF